MNIAFPFSFDRTGHVARPDSRRDHIAQMIDQVLFTNPGERVMLPTFGTGLLQYVFAPLSPEAQQGLETQVQASLQEWLGDLIEVQGVDISATASRLDVDIRYAILPGDPPEQRRFSAAVAQ